MHWRRPRMYRLVFRNDKIVMLLPRVNKVFCQKKSFSYYEPFLHEVTLSQSLRQIARLWDDVERGQRRWGRKSNFAEPRSIVRTLSMKSFLALGKVNTSDSFALLCELNLNALSTEPLVALLHPSSHILQRDFVTRSDNNWFRVQALFFFCLVAISTVIVNSTPSKQKKVSHVGWRRKKEEKTLLLCSTMPSVYTLMLDMYYNGIGEVEHAIVLNNIRSYSIFRAKSQHQCGVGNLSEF